MTPRRAAVSRHQSRRISRSAARPSERHSGAPVLQVAPPIKTPRPPDGTPRISGTRVRRQVESAHPAVTLPTDIAADLLAGKLEQVCPTCGLREAAGGYCTADGAPTGPADWRRGTARQAQSAASRARAHAVAETGATALETANPEPLGLWPA